jgi:ketosteroid isomerase-like protein
MNAVPPNVGRAPVDAAATRGHDDACRSQRAGGDRDKGETMSAEDVTVLRDAYGAFARQDIPGVMAAFDENIEWRTPDSLPFGGTYHGHDGVGGFFGQLGTYWHELSVEPEEFIDGGDTIVVVARVRGTAAGGALDQQHVHIWRMRGGKAASCTEYSDTARALQALGQGIPATA